MNLNEPIVAIEYFGSATVVTPQPGELLDVSLILRLQETIYPLAEDEGVNLIVDFSRVQSISSMVLGCLLELKKMVEKGHGRLILCGVNQKVINTPDDRYVHEIFKVARLDSFFEICARVPEAIRQLQVPCHTF